MKWQWGALMRDVFKMSHPDNAIFFGALAALSLWMFVAEGWLPLALSGIACSIACARFATLGVRVQEAGPAAVARELFGE